MIKFPFIGGTTAHRKSIAFSPQRTVNLYPEQDPNYKDPLVLDGFPGLEQWADFEKPLRAGILFKDYAVVVAGNVVHAIEKSGATSSIGILSKTTDIIDMDENGLELMIVDGDSGYVWDDERFRIIGDSTFRQLKSDSVAYLDSAFVVNRPGTGQIFASDSFDALTWNAAKTATAEYKSDHVVSVWTDRELFLGGTRTTQVYWNRGTSPMPFEPLRQGRIIYGIAARRSIAVMDNTSHALFRDEHGGVFVGRLNGYAVERVSPPGLNKFWHSIDYKDAYAFPMHWAGHEFYILTFPVADHGFGRTFCYDASTKLWFELGVWNASIGDFAKFPGVFHVFLGEQSLIGADDGKLYRVSDSVFKYGESEIVSLRRAPVIHNHRERIFFDKLQIDMDVGHGLNSGQGSDPVCRLEISDDGGRSFKNYREKSIGQTGEHEQRVQFHQLGSSYDRVFQVSISDPVPRRFISGYVDG